VPLTAAGRIRRAWPVLVAALVCATITPAAADDVQFWPTFTVQSPTLDGWRGSAEIHARWTDDLETYNRTVFRLNGGRLITPRLELFGGWELTQPNTRAVAHEQRLWEQVEYTVRSRRWSFANRARLEQRFVQGAEAMASRLRYRFRVQRPLGRTGWLLSASDELWVHLNSVAATARRGIDQNRVAVTAARAINPHVSFEPGYLYINANAPRPLRNRGAHVMTLQVTARF
jgi:hypothetical protein